jgi:signal transduction histidine kinase
MIPEIHQLPLGPDQLAPEILRLAQAEAPRPEFFRRLCAALASTVRSGTVNLWVVEGPVWLDLRWDRDGGFSARKRPAPERVTVEALSLLAGWEPEGWDHDVLTVRVGRAPDASSVTVLPLVAGDRTLGWLAFPGSDPAYLVEREAEEFLRVSETLAIALEQQRLLAAVRERVKELTCTYGLSGLIDGPDALEILLAKAAALIPPALQYPEVAVAGIVLDGDSYGEDVDRVTAEFKTPLIIGGAERGWVEVGYTEEPPQLGDAVFLPEEIELLATVARQISGLVERRENAHQREKLERRLRHADRLATIGTLSAGVAHELNEPLGAVLGFAQLAAGHPDVPEAVSGDLKKIEDAALHAREIVRQLMLFARRDPPLTQSTEWEAVVTAALELTSVRCREAGIVVVEERDAENVLVDADPARLQQVVVNLIVNAVQAMPEGGTLTLRTRSEDESAVLEVEDTGVGMDERVRERIFVPFFTTKDVNEGTGLGLAVVHGIVTAHEGSIVVDSVPGKGSRFEVRLPRSGRAVSRSKGDRR